MDSENSVPGTILIKDDTRLVRGPEFRADAPGSGRQPEASSLAKALVTNAIGKWRVSGDDAYDSLAKNLRSPSITEQTFNHGIQDTSGITLELSEPLGEGAIGIVYKGTAIGGVAGLRGDLEVASEPLPVALKTVKNFDPNNPLSTADARKILSMLEEAYALEEIRKMQQKLYPESKLFVPDGLLIQNYNGAPALALEYIPPKDKLFKWDEAKGGIQSLNPQQFVSTCSQYFELQDVIHKAGFTCNDRKSTDIYYQQDGDRLIVADWNVTRPIKSLQDPNDVRTINADLLKGFGLFEKLADDSLSPQIRTLFQELETTIRANMDIPFETSEIIQKLKGLLQETPQTSSLQVKEQPQLANTEILAASQVDKPEEPVRPLESWEIESLQEILGVDLTTKFQTMVEGAGQFGRTLDLAKKTPPSPLRDAIMFSADYNRALVLENINNPDWDYSQQYWSQRFNRDVVDYYLSGNHMNPQQRERLKTNINELLADQQVKSEYFDKGKTPIPQELIDLAETA